MVRHRALLSRNVQILMNRHGHSQQSLHRGSGVSQAKISYLIRRTQPTGLDVIDRLAFYFDLEAWQLLTKLPK